MFMLFSVFQNHRYACKSISQKNSYKAYVYFEQWFIYISNIWTGIGNIFLASLTLLVHICLVLTRHSVTVSFRDWVGRKFSSDWDGKLGWAKMHEVFKYLLPRYFLKDIYVKWSQFEFQTIWSNFHYTPRRLKFLLTIIVLAKFRLKMIFEFFLIKVSQKL